MTSPVRQAIDTVRALAGLPGRVAALERDIHMLADDHLDLRDVVNGHDQRIADARSLIGEWVSEEARRGR